MAEPKTPKPKPTPKPKTPKAKPTPPGQGSIDFNGGGRGGALQRWQPDFVRQGRGRLLGGSNQILADARIFGVGEGTSGANARPSVRQPDGTFTAPGRGNIYDTSSRYNPGRLNNRDVYSAPHVATSGAAQAVRDSQPGRGALAVIPKTSASTPSRTRSVTPPGNSFGSNGVKATGPFGGRVTPPGNSTVVKPTGLGDKSRTRPVTPPGNSTVVKSTSLGDNSRTRSVTPPGNSFGSNGVKATGPFGGRVTPISSAENSAGSRFNAMGPTDPRARPPGVSSSGKNNPIGSPGAALGRTQPGGALVRTQPLAIDDFAKGTKLPKGMNPRLKGRLLGGALIAAAAGGLTYLATRKRNENEAAAKPAAASPEVTVAGRNAPPGAGNGPDAQLYPPAGGGAGSGKGATAGTTPGQPSLTDRVRGNNKANRNPEEYLGEAFDATVKRGREVGRKHLQGMIVRDSVDSDTANKLMSRYDKEINQQSTLKDYKSKGVTQDFDRENPGKAGRLLDEYRSMGRNPNAAPKNATLADLKARALR